MSWITVTPSIKRAAEIINGLEASKFPLLVNRIMQAMQSGAENERAFSDEEENKLEISLGLGREDLKLLLDATTFITEQAAYHVTKPAVLQRQLIEVLQFNEDKAEAFVSIWTNSAKGIVEQLRQKSVFPNQLEDIRWSLNLQTASDAHSREAVPKAVFQLGLKTDGCQRENISLEFTHQELFSFYKQLEAVQSQLDGLH